MPKSTSLFLFPDINVWLALAYDRHLHHSVAKQWFESLERDAQLFICRFVQMGFVRLLTTAAVMGADQAMTQSQAWEVYDRCMAQGRTTFLEEPVGIERCFRALSQEKRPAPKDWADSYLAAFAAEAGLCLVTFDQGLSKKCEGAILLTIG